MTSLGEPAAPPARAPVPRAPEPAGATRLLMRATRALPRVKGLGAVANVAKRIHARGRPQVVEAEVHGFRLRLDPREHIDRELLFTPQLYDREMLDYLRGALRPGERFLDGGANLGVFGLVASRLVGATGRVVSVDADPEMFQLLAHHVQLNGASNITPLNVGLGDEDTTLAFRPGPEGLRGCGTFIHAEPAPGDIRVPVHKLLTLMDRQGIARFDGMKLDVEGFEYRTMRAFFAEAPQERWPRFAIVESLPHLFERAGGDAVDLFRARGYRTHWAKGADHILVLD